MRKVKLQMQVSIDGFVAGKNGEMDWMTWNWDDPLKAHINQLTEPVDCIILGRKLAQGFIDHWKSTAENSEKADDFAQKMNDTPKKVFTKTLTENKWENTELITGELSHEIGKLKNQEGGDIIVYGGGSFVSSLIKGNLIDEYHFCINPVVLGKGMPIFEEVEDKLKLEFVNSFPFKCGIVVNQYNMKEEK